MIEQSPVDSVVTAYHLLLLLPCCTHQHNVISCRNDVRELTRLGISLRVVGQLCDLNIGRLCSSQFVIFFALIYARVLPVLSQRVYSLFVSRDI